MLDEANAVRDDGMPRTWQSMLTVDPFVNHSKKNMLSIMNGQRYTVSSHNIWYIWCSFLMNVASLVPEK